MTETDASRIARLLDEQSIREVGARFADAATRGDHAALRRCWSADAEWIIGGDDEQPYRRTATGVDAIVSLYRGLWEEKEFFVQFTIQGPINIDGDRATARSTCHESARGPGDAGYRTDGMWFDELRRDGDGWVFTRRRFQYLWLDTSPFTGAGYRPVAP